MSEINWDKPFHVHLTLAGLGDVAVSGPTYGNFGGPAYSAGMFIGSPDPAQFDPVPVNALDQRFQDHDLASYAATTSAQQSAADLALIQGIQATDLSGIDAEASLYGGAATLVMIEQLAARGDLDLLPPETIFNIVGDAAQNIGQGVAALSEDDIAGARVWLNEFGNDWPFS
jgi:hypothetical protein